MPQRHKRCQTLIQTGSPKNRFPLKICPVFRRMVKAHRNHIAGRSFRKRGGRRKLLHHRHFRPAGVNVSLSSLLVVSQMSRLHLVTDAFQHIVYGPGVIQVEIPLIFQMIIIISEQNRKKRHSRIRQPAHPYSGHTVPCQRHMRHRHVVKLLSRSLHHGKQFILWNRDLLPEPVNLILGCPAPRQSLIQLLKNTVEPAVVIFRRG